jgi:predicted alpha/beta-fold hydrolase
MLRKDNKIFNVEKECAKFLLEDKQILCYIADATGFGFGDKYNLNWKRGTHQEKHPLFVLFFGISGYLQLTYFYYFCLVFCTIATLKGDGRFLEQS